MAARTAPSCDELARLYTAEGLGVAAIARRFGCSAPTVSNWLRRCGIPTRTGRFRACDVPREQLVQLYSVEGRSLRAIAAQLGVSVGTVNNRLRSYGIARRGAARATGAAGGSGGES
jgi:transposase